MVHDAVGMVLKRLPEHVRTQMIGIDSMESSNGSTDAGTGAAADTTLRREGQQVEGATDGDEARGGIKESDNR